MTKCIVTLHLIHKKDKVSYLELIKFYVFYYKLFNKMFERLLIKENDTT